MILQILTLLALAGCLEFHPVMGENLRGQVLPQVVDIEQQPEAQLEGRLESIQRPNQPIQRIDSQPEKPNKREEELFDAEGRVGNLEVQLEGHLESIQKPIQSQPIQSQPIQSQPIHSKKSDTEEEQLLNMERRVADFGSDNIDQAVTVFSRGTYANNSPFWMKSDIVYIKRECKYCVDTHKTIIYKRLTPKPAEMDYEKLFLRDWFSDGLISGNTFNVDFQLFSNMDDAIWDENPWTFCNFNDPGIGFPRDCGPSGYVASQWTSQYRYPSLQVDVAFYVFPMIDYHIDFSLESPHNTQYTLSGGAQVLGPAPGGVSKALRIDHAGAYVKIPGVNISHSTMPECTIMVGLYLESIANNAWVFGMGNGANERSILMYGDWSGGAVSLDIGGETTNGIVPTKEWVHVAAVFRQRECYVYLNGIVVLEYTALEYFSNEGLGDIWIGWPLYNSHFDSWIKEVTVLNWAMTDFEVMKHSSDFLSSTHLLDSSGGV